MAAGAAAPAGAPASGVAQPVSTALLVDKICALLVMKGPPMLAQLEQKLRANEGITTKGIFISPDVLREALQRHRAARAAATTAPPHAPAPMASAARWQPTVSDAALANKALAECEDAKAFCEQVRVVGANKVAILPRPNVLLKPTGEYLNPGDNVQVIARAVLPRDGRVYLRLRDKNGWVSTRSRREFGRVVLALSSGGALLEPPELTRSPATQMLPQVDESGMPPQARAGEAAPPWEPRQFRTLSSVSLLSQPSVATALSGPSSKIASGEQVSAVGVFLQPLDGRVYLRLEGGRGWVSERSRTDFGKFAVEPCGAGGGGRARAPAEASDDEPLAAAGGQASQGARKGVVEMARAPSRAPTPADEAKAAQARVPPATGPALFRSDAALWPKELQPPRPLDLGARRKLRRLFAAFGARARQCEADIGEVCERIAGYKRACDAQRELQQYAEALKKEADKLQKRWAEAVREQLAAELAAAEGRPPASLAAPTAGLGAAVLRGTRCFYAELRGGGAAAEAAAAAPAAARLLGPIRPSAAAASEDLERMRRHLAGHRPAAAACEAGPPSSEPPRKRLRRFDGDAAEKAGCATAAAAGG